MNLNILKTKDIEDILHISSLKAYALMHMPGFPSKKIGRTFVVLEEDFKEWLDGVDEVKIDYPYYSNNEESKYNL